MTSRPTQSYTELRRFTEKWQWVDPISGVKVTGYVHPQTAKKPMRVPFYIKFLTKSGHVVDGNCICLSVDTMRHQRNVQFVISKQVRVVNDVLVIEVDGTRFVTH